MPAGELIARNPGASRGPLSHPFPPPPRRLHGRDEHVAVVLPASPGLQEALVEEAPDAYYRPPYVGAAGWIGVELDQVTDEALESHIRQAWQLIVNKAGKR